MLENIYMHLTSYIDPQIYIYTQIKESHEVSMRRKEAFSFLRAAGLNREERNERYCQLDGISRLLDYLYTQPAGPFFWIQPSSQNFKIKQIAMWKKVRKCMEFKKKTQTSSKVK